MRRIISLSSKSDELIFLVFDQIREVGHLLSIQEVVVINHHMPQTVLNLGISRQDPGPVVLRGTPDKGERENAAASYLPAEAGRTEK